jgi:drug/metabolite transporter (DMT)-like permease
VFAAAVAVTLAACFLFSLSAWLVQHAGARHEHKTGGIHGIGRLIVSMVQHPLWLVGSLCGIVAFWLQAVALHWTGLSVVQPLMPTQLLFAVLLASTSARRRPLLRDLFAALAVGAGVAVLVLKARPPAVDPNPHHIISLVVGIAVVMAALLYAAHHFRPTIAAAITATAAGSGFALTAVFLKLVADRLADGEYVRLLHYLPTYGLVASMVVSTVLVQAALAAGPLPWSMAGMTVAEPIAGIAAAWVAFGSRPPHLVITLTAGTLLIVGVGGLLSSPAAELWVPKPGSGVDGADAALADAGVEFEHLADRAAPGELLGPRPGSGPPG